MNEFTLRTERLLLRPFQPEDLEELRALFTDLTERQIAECFSYSTLYLGIETWLEAVTRHGESASSLLALVRREDGRLIGGEGLLIDSENQRAALRGWCGAPYRGQGYGAEGARWMVRRAFEDFGLHRVTASCLHSRPAAGNVLKAAGLRFEGWRREHERWNDHFEDVVLYGQLRDAWKEDATNERT